MNLYHEAERPFLNSIKIDPNNIGAHNNLAAVYFKLNRLADAILHYESIIQENPNYAEAHNNLAVALVANKLKEEGLKEYKIAIRLNPEYADAYNNIGLLYQQDNICQLPTLNNKLSQ